MRIGFHLRYDFHHAMLDPIYALLKDEFPCLMTKDANAIIDFKPKILVLADAHYHIFREKLAGTIIIWVRHGFSDKNLARHCITGCDFACVSSTWVRDEYIRLGMQPRLGYWVTGFVPMDKVLAQDNHTECASFFDDVLRGKTNLLYAPTYNKYLSSAEVLGSQWIDSIARSMPEIKIIIKPHPVIPRRFSRWMAMWRDAARRNKQVVLIEDTNADIYKYLGSADILLSDASSVIFYFLAFNRPIILVNNPQRFKEQIYFNPAGYEWTWRDMGIQIEHRDELPHALQRCLQYPEEFSKQRTFYRKRIFGNLLDGRAAERTVKRIRALCNPTARDKKWVTRSWDAALAFSRLDKRRLVLLHIRLFLTPLRERLRRYPGIFVMFKKAFQRLGALYINEHKGQGSDS